MQAIYNWPSKLSFKMLFNKEKKTKLKKIKRKFSLKKILHLPNKTLDYHREKIQQLLLIKILI